jgi:hypothetical protein
MTFGDMLVGGSPPPQLSKALRVISESLHPQFAKNWRMPPDKSKESCILCSLTVREFLIASGFTSARVAPVCTTMAAWQDDKLLHSLGIGSPEDHEILPGKWNGHMIVIEPSTGYLIDTTLYQAQRKQWPDLPGMIAGPLWAERVKGLYLGLDAISGLTLRDDDRPGYSFEIAWLDRPGHNSWRDGPDANKTRLQRRAIVKQMLKQTGVQP